LKVVIEGGEKADRMFPPQKLEIFLLVSKQPVMPWTNGWHREI
jgi:hypothetical protein